MGKKKKLMRLLATDKDKMFHLTVAGSQKKANPISTELSFKKLENIEFLFNEKSGKFRRLYNQVWIRNEQ